VMLMDQEYAPSEIAVSPVTRRLVALDTAAHDWFTAAGVQVVLVRPDFYAYGAVADVRDTSRLVERALDDLALRTDRPTPTGSASRTN